MAKNAAEQVKEQGEVSAAGADVGVSSVSACTTSINATPGVESESEGVEPNRRIVVRPSN